MPRTTWFKKLWDWKFKGRKLERKKRMRSFKIEKVNKNYQSNKGVKCVKGVKVRCYDYSGRDLTPYLKSSFTYNGIPGGFYLDTSKLT
jgi:hypothetical protein